MSETSLIPNYEFINSAETSAVVGDYLDSLRPIQPQEAPIISDQQPNNTSNVFQLRTPESVKAYAEAVSGSVGDMRRRELENVA